MGPAWVLSAPDGSHVGPMNLAIREGVQRSLQWCIIHVGPAPIDVMDLFVLRCTSRRLHHTGSWWRYQMETFSALLAICAGNSPVTGEFPAQRPVRRSFDVLVCDWLNGWVNNGEAGDLRRHRAHYNVTVMIAEQIDKCFKCTLWYIQCYYYATCNGHSSVSHTETCTKWRPFCRQKLNFQLRVTW